VPQFWPPPVVYPGAIATALGNEVMLMHGCAAR
jgi:hypothetical protein